MKRSLKLNVLICTIDRNISNVHKILLSYRNDVTYIVSHQYRDKKFKEIPAELIREDVIISQISGGGLSRNRNNALKFADGDFAIIADDDVKYLPDAFETVKSVFERDPSLDVACFKIKTKENEPEYKNYPIEDYSFNNGKKHFVSSIEIAFRVNRIREKKILFDERFGLGSKIFQSGEEAVFINDCVKNNLNVRFIPVYVVSHPFERSTKGGRPFDRHKIIIQGAVDARRSGWLSIIKSFYLLIRLFPALIVYRKNPFSYLIQRLSGVQFILKSK